MLKKFLSFLMCAILLCGLLPAFAEETLTEKTFPLYLDDIEHVDEIHLVFPDGNEEIPYVSADEMCRLLNYICHDLCMDEGYQLTLHPQGVNALLIRENGADTLIDFENSVISFNQYDAFVSRSNAVNPLDMLVLGKHASGNEDPDVFLINHENTFSCNGNYTAFDLKEYGIPTPVSGEKGYLPLQTFSDIFFTGTGTALCWNGQIAVLASSAALIDSMQMQTPLGELYYSVPVRERSEALIEFNLNELCLALDFHYGLKEEHNIENFRDYFTRSGLVLDLTNPDAQVSNSALSRLCMQHFSDGHSSLVAASPYAEYGSAAVNLDGMSVGLITKLMAILEYNAARTTAYPEGTPAYEEVGNTAYVTFDIFTLDAFKDYYTAEIPENMLAETADTLDLLIYAAGQINRENSPVENVVIDLSNNGGGALDAAVCVCAWALGTHTLYIEDTATGGQSSTLYTFDANLNHVFNDSGDSVRTKNLFCLISPNSFSCGNLVPAVFRASGKVTLLGKASTGGACVVQVLSTADGSLFAVSGRRRINTCNNGVLYSVDAGVEPHYYLPKSAMFYNRQKLTDYINSLMW